MSGCKNTFLPKPSEGLVNTLEISFSGHDALHPMLTHTSSSGEFRIHPYMQSNVFTWNYCIYPCSQPNSICRCFELPPTSKFLVLRVWLGWCAERTQGLYWFGQKVPTSNSSLLLVLLALKVCSRGYKWAREGKDPKSLVKGVNRC